MNLKKVLPCAFTLDRLQYSYLLPEILLLSSVITWDFLQNETCDFIFLVKLPLKNLSDFSCYLYLPGFEHLSLKLYDNDHYCIANNRKILSLCRCTKQLSKHFMSVAGS